MVSNDSEEVLRDSFWSLGVVMLRELTLGLDTCLESDGVSLLAELFLFLPIYSFRVFDA
jgi:hypothetical protein